MRTQEVRKRTFVVIGPVRASLSRAVRGQRPAVGWRPRIGPGPEATGYALRTQPVNPDVAIARVAALQHGVVTFEQLLRAGLSRTGIQRRIAAGRLHRIHRGVYAVGHTGLSSKGTWKAATLACGEGTVLSHRSAAELWGMLAPSDGPVHVTVGSGLRFLQLCRRHRLPEPEQNTLIEEFEVDFLWRDHRVVVETDGFDAHRGPVAFELDRHRDARLMALGYVVLRLTRRQILGEPAMVAALIRQQLQR